MVAGIKRLARDEHQRELQVFGMAYIVLGDTDKEAKDKLREYAIAKGDWTGTNALLDIVIPNSQSATPAQYRARAFNMINGYAALSLVGTAQQIVDGLLQLEEAGLDGLTLSWLDYFEGLDEYRDKLLPLLIQAGLRVDPTGAAPTAAPARAHGSYAGDRIVTALQAEVVAADAPPPAAFATEAHT